jgi:flagellar biosynthesis regulator FlaF
LEETLEEAQAPAPKGKADAAPVTEPESIASVDKAADATKQAPVPKTKAGMISAMYGKLNSMKKVDLQASYGKVMGEDLEVAGETVAETIDTTSELDALVESEATLSEEFKEKTAVIFEAAVKSKLSEEVDRLETQYKEELSEEVSSIKGDLVEKVDSYLNYVVESWMDENKVAVQNGLRTEIAETFMDKMKDLFTESYIDVPESKVDLVDELAEQVSELEEKLNAQTGDAIKLSEELEVLQRDAIIAEASRGLADTQVEKLKGLVEGIDFDEDTFAQKVGIIIESHFAKEPSANEEVEVVSEDVDQTVEVSSSMAQYVSALQKTIK